MARNEVFYLVETGVYLNSRSATPSERRRVRAMGLEPTRTKLLRGQSGSFFWSKDEKNQAKGHDSEGQASRIDGIFSDMGTERDLRKAILPEIKGDVPKAAEETVNPEVITPEDASRILQQKEQDAEVEADEPEMWVSFMDTMPLPAKTEETVSEIELDELSMMLSEGEDESEDGEEEEAEKAVPETPKKKAKRKKKKKKKKGKKSKQSAKSDPENEQANKKLETAQSGAHSTPAVDSPLGADGEISVPTSEKSPVAEMNIVENAPLQTRGLEENDGEDNKKLRPQELKALVNGKGEESFEDEMDSSDKESDDVFPLADDRGEFYAGVSSSDESFDAQSDEAELWISGIDEVQNADGMGSRSASTITKEKKPSKADDAELAAFAPLSSVMKQVKTRRIHTCRLHLMVVWTLTMTSPKTHSVARNQVRKGKPPTKLTLKLVIVTLSKFCWGGKCLEFWDVQYSR
ncbi:hypothetical protein R1sor_013144 [Riccia sorocarpa]|uniref:Uncharacterized protein n=1 Tax=Riccia sorocarpa TaxID=122646 RepID=A0ABD3H5P1_9MARC